MYVESGLHIKNIIILLVFTLVTCDSSSKKSELASELVKKSISNMTVVKDGELIMGDFGPLVGEHVPYSIQQDDKKLHKVILSRFMISKYKVTNKSYNMYLDITGKKRPSVSPFTKDYPLLLGDGYSAIATCQQAKDYCLLLGEQSGKKLIYLQRLNGSMRLVQRISIYLLLPIMER